MTKEPRIEGEGSLIKRKTIGECETGKVTYVCTFVAPNLSRNNLRAERLTSKVKVRSDDIPRSARGRFDRRRRGEPSRKSDTASSPLQGFGDCKNGKTTDPTSQANGNITKRRARKGSGRRLTGGISLGRLGEREAAADEAAVEAAVPVPIQSSWNTRTFANESLRRTKITRFQAEFRQNANSWTVCRTVFRQW